MDSSSSSSVENSLVFINKRKRFYRSPLYVTLLLLFLVSAASSTYIVFGMNSTAVSVPTLPTQSPLPALSPTDASGTNLVALSPVPTKTSSSVTPTPRIDLTQNWNVFSNTQYGYTIKYPTGWVVQNEGSLETLIPNFVVFNQLAASESAKSITISYTTRTAAQLSTIYTGIGQKLSIGTSSATEYDQKDSDGNQTTSVTMSLPNNGFVFFATDAYRSILLQMLQTFTLTK